MYLLQIIPECKTDPTLMYRDESEGRLLKCGVLQFRFMRGLISGKSEYLTKWNTAVQMSGMREGINSGLPHANFSRANFKGKRKTYKTTAVSQSKRKKIETFMKIC